MKGRKAPLFFVKMGRDLIINVDMIIVKGLKKYRGATINEDLLPAGHAEILISKGNLVDPTVEVEETPSAKKTPRKK